MARLSLVFLLSMLLMACYLPTFPERPALTDNLTHPLGARPDVQAVLLWLPQTQMHNVAGYRLAVEQSLSTLLSDQAMWQRSKAAQNILDQALQQQGGLFDPATGRFNSTGLMTAFAQVNTYIATEMPTVTDIVYINLLQQQVRVKDGIARWDNVQQKVTDMGGSVRYVTAVSLKLTYNIAEQQVTEQLGLDIEPAPVGPHQRYDNILRRAFAPYLQQ